MNERRRYINDYIQRKQQAWLSELRELVPDVSEMTIRRDLEALEKEGTIIRIHGGAKSVSSINKLVEDVFSERSVINTEEKHIIGQKAAKLIKPDNSIYIDSGSTMMALARAISDERLLILTNGLNVAAELLSMNNAIVNIIGGEVSRNSISISGPQAINSITKFNIDIAFIAATAFSKDAGFTCGNIHDSDLKDKVLKKAHLRVILMDSSKIGHTMPYTFSMPADIDILVTDNGATDDVKDFFRNHAVEVI